ncbi:MAG TPA: thiamine-phosphate kinase [Pirellulales bacterium]|jgi:thiamine-monophosphate kinase|nr:thiamine-phosphate kinase [Pirellulales bacterium]
MESSFIAWLRTVCPPHPALAVGPGDDAAVLSVAGGGQLVVTTDLLTEGVDFLLAEHDPRRIGHKALAANLSDLAAMAARPLAVVIALALPEQGADSLARDLYGGILPLAARFGVAIAGGDTNTWAGGLAISITAIGTPTARGPLLRSGARPGDRILVTGSLGGSILGRHFDFEPRLAEALLLADRYQLHAGIDVSDGLSLDLSRLASESGCGAKIDFSQIPVSDAAVQLAAQGDDGQTALDHALADGEDFELVLAVPPGEAERILRDQPLDIPITAIGEFITEPGLWESSAAGTRPLAPRGYEH